MIGAMIGDIVGSVYEWNNIKTKDFPLFREDCFFTDDTVITLATADAIMQGGAKDDFIRAYQSWGKKYPGAGYGGMFSGWIYDQNPQPYNSWGNGSAMRVAPCGWVAQTLEEAERLATLSASVTHNHPEGVQGAVEVARAIWLLRQSSDIVTIKEQIIAQSDYDLSRTLDEIRPTYQFNESSRDTVPQAIIAFLESTDFEDAIRNAISLGGDSDTLAAITGSIAEAAYGVPEWIKRKAVDYLDEELKTIYERWKSS